MTDQEQVIKSIKDKYFKGKKVSVKVKNNTINFNLKKPKCSPYKKLMKAMLL